MVNGRMSKMRRQQLPQLVIAVTLVMLFLMGCGNTASTPVSEAPVAAPTLEPPTATPTPEPPTPTEDPKPEESVAIEESATDGPHIGDVAPDFTLPDSNGNMVNLADELQKNEQVVLVFYYGHSCPPCMAQLREIENDRAKYEGTGTQVMAIAVQREEGAGISAKTSGAQFPILADSDHAVAEAYGVEDYGWSTPSVFVVNQGGHVIWKHISIIEGRDCGKERVPSQTILENLSG